MPQRIHPSSIESSVRWEQNGFWTSSRPTSLQVVIDFAQQWVRLGCLTQANNRYKHNINLRHIIQGHIRHVLTISINR